MNVYIMLIVFVVVVVAQGWQQIKLENKERG